MGFKVGDKVRVKSGINDGWVGRVNDITINCACGKPYYVVNEISSGWASEDELEAVMNFKVGDKVRIIKHQDGKIERLDIYDGKEMYFVRHEDGAAMYYSKDLQKILDDRPTIEVKPVSDQLFVDGIAIRMELKWFTILMESRLRENDLKRSCSNLTVSELKDLLEGKFEELVEAHQECDSVGVAEECVALANYCMMIADKIMSRSEKKK